MCEKLDELIVLCEMANFDGWLTDIKSACEGDDEGKGAGETEKI